MNTEQITTFFEICRLGNFSEAARSLGISQPAVSFQVQRLEQELGVRLLDRSQRNVTPTAAGRMLLEFGTKMQSDWNKLVREVERLRDDIAGDLVIAASNIPGEYILPPLLASFKRRNPAVTIRVNVMDSQQVIDGVLNSTFEVGFCGIAPDNKALSTVPIAGDEIVLIVPSSHPFKSRKQISIDELAGEHFIAREPSSGTRRTFEQHLEKAGFDVRKMPPHLILGSTQAVISAVAAGAGIAFVSNLALGNQPSEKGVSRITVSGLEIKRSFFCIYREGQIDSRLVEAFTVFVSSSETIREQE